MKRKLRDDELIPEYRRAALDYHLELVNAKPRKVNAAYDRAVSIFNQIKERGKIDEFLSLLLDEEIAVQAWAAAHALPYSPRQAEAVLERLAVSGSPFISLGSELVLKQWRAGTFVPQE